jgi:hypothetical protein
LSDCTPPKAEEPDSWDLAASILSDSVLQLADQHLFDPPITVTAAQSPRSAGGIHDFYSEGDYWWPDSANPDGPYQRRDGLTNPDNFTAHRQALMRFSELVGTLTSAYLITQDTVYAGAAIRHMRAWFVNEKTRMNPNLLYAQAIQGRHTGRGIGIIDAIHLMEVVQSIRMLEKAGKVESADLISMRAWFADFVQWLTTHPYGIDEMVHPNNHGSCWNMQVGLYALFTQNDSLLDACRNNYRQTLLPTQMAADGSFPLELARTKPYGYALFNLDALVMNCLILSDPTHDLWSFSNESGAGIREGLAYMAPYVADKSQWPLAPDVMYWENWPVAQPAFLFGGLHFGRADWIDLWKTNRHFLEVPEVKRNVPIRNPLLWLGDLDASPSNAQ